MIDHKRALQLMKSGQDAYEKVKNKEWHYVYWKNNRYHELVFTPQKQQFFHLCGIANYRDPKTGRIYRANQFYDFLKRSQINLDWIEPGDNYDEKLQVISELKELTNCKSLRIIDTTVTFLNMTFDRGIRSGKRIFCIGLVGGDMRLVDGYVPKTLLNLSKNPQGPNVGAGNPVHCIYSVEGKEKQRTVVCRTDEFITYETTRSYPYQGTL